jgi:SNF2 family DNA or RNA helicase
MHHHQRALRHRGEWLQILHREHEERCSATTLATKRPREDGDANDDTAPASKRPRLEQLREPLWPHQREALEFLAAREAAGDGVLLLDGMRLGKSAEALAYLWHDLQRRIARGEPRVSGAPTLVVVPKLLLDTWLREWLRLFGSPATSWLRLVVASSGERLSPEAAAAGGDAAFAQALASVAWLDPHATAHQVASRADVVLTTYPTLLVGAATARFAALLQVRWRRVVADEGHLFCGGSSPDAGAQFRVMHHRLQADHKWLLSATIVQNSTRDLRKALLYVGVTSPLPAHDDAVGVRALVERLALCRQAVARAGDVVDDRVLPGFATAAEQALYDALHGALASSSALTEQTRLRQLCLNPALLPAPLLAALCAHAGVAAADVPVISTKEQHVLALLRDVVEPAGEKLIVYCSYVAELQRLDALLRAAAPAGSAGAARHVLVHGELASDDERVEALARFSRDPRVSCLLITTDLGAYGLDLSAANHAVLMDPRWNPYKEAQAMARMQGPRQRRALHMHRLIIAGTLDEHVVARADAKRTLLPRLVPPVRAVDVKREGGLPHLLSQLLLLRDATSAEV